MKLFVSTLALFSALLYVNAITYVPGIRIYPTVTTFGVEDYSCDPAMGLGDQCASDCRSMLHCGTGPEPLQVFTCSTDNKYCVGKKCQSTPDLSNQNCLDTKPYTCFMEGHYPDPTEAQRYYYCPAGGASGTQIQQFICPSGFVFDSYTNLCGEQATLGSFTVQCVYGQYRQYTPNPAFYIKCAQEPPHVVGRCPNIHTDTFDINTLQCSTVCKKIGYSPIAGDNTSYNFCSAIGQQPTVGKCATNYVFLVNSCVPKT